MVVKIIAVLAIVSLFYISEVRFCMGNHWFQVKKLSHVFVFYGRYSSRRFS